MTKLTRRAALILITALAAPACTVQLAEEAAEDTATVEGPAPVEAPEQAPPQLAPPEEEAPEDPPAEEEEAPFVAPELVSVRLVDALIRPWDVNGEAWDGTNLVKQEDVNELAVLLGYADPYAAVAGFTIALMNDYLGAPDAYGEVRIFVDGSWQPHLAQDLSVTPQSVTPSFYEVGWDYVPLEPNVRISLTLVDDDGGWTADDPIGTVELNHDDLLDAVKAGQVHDVPVHDQGQGEILFVGISVVPQD